ncbi:MAG TPA: HNH endonuclease signature motif containing protein [Terriglobia bacterium]|nr:HNH endonuclease signature motif containing protein [Terriglobia bacterium]
MKLSDLTETSAVEKAIAEFDGIGRDAFLEKYGFGRAKNYFLQREEKLYDSKAIAGAAIGFQFPTAGPLTHGDFSGGEKTVSEKLTALGFEMIKLSESEWSGKGPSDLHRGDQISNADLCAVFRCGTSGGMRRSHATQSLVIVSDPTKGMYIDEWRDGVLHYTGMGLRGDQTLEGNQNLTLAESKTNGVSIHLFEVYEEGVYSYEGKVELAAKPYRAKQPDADGKIRNVWMFPVRRVGGGNLLPVPQEAIKRNADRQRKDAERLSNADLTARARLRSKPASSREARTVVHIRDEYVAEYARRRANGKCELCRQPAPFINRRDEPYLECHHVIWLARGGHDSIQNTVALCPNCHRKMHVLDRAEDRKKLQARAAIEIAV